MLAPVEFEGEERVRAAHAQGKGVLFFTGHFGYWEIKRSVHALALQPMARARAAARQPAAARPARAVRATTGNSVIYRHGAVRRSCARSAPTRRVALLIDQHMHSRRRDLRGLLQPPGGDDLDAGGAGAAHRRAGVPVFALPLPGGRYRMIYEHP